MDEARSIREFWFGPLPLTAAQLDKRMSFWFGATRSAVRAQRDATIRQRFGTLLQRAAGGELTAWADGPRRRLSLIILLDQFPRHIYRGTARAFLHDAQALQLTLSGMQSAGDAALDVVERIFFYMPLQHAENREVQDESVAAYRRLLTEAPQALHAVFAGALRSAENHRELIERFGRFPHRNPLLDRTSTREENEWLRRGGDSFGQ
ncbi:MAG: DUF924 domain-containing protein [Gammaproteobacteria bacterium]|nr:DUF924 domain-containing protein [Gammaproteobacteria bacterium]